ncbi:MAG: HAD family hydrolase [Chloroflexi bacterium]|nr:HAD family hydrolase [Chloroflexota bacterium]MCI0813875.1 HAD family hydrolase [Chloroflexota bacterium]
MTRPRTILFDIDNTLLNTGGAGGHAMNRAFAELFGVDDGFGKIEFSGRTDLFILQSALDDGEIDGGTQEHMDAFVSAYARLLPESLVERKGHVMPGFPQLLNELREAGAQLGLATGNFSEGARLKLEFYELAGHFAGGGFGEVSRERSEVVAVAIREVAGGAQPEDVMVVGDTPHDITATLANGAIGVGVATGNYSVEELRESGAQITFEDFSDHESAAEQLLKFEPGT